MAKLVSQPSPAARWPALAVDPALPPTDPIRAGQALFVVQCLTCHKLNGAGAADVGPDLNLPRNPTEYLTPQGLHDLIRKPESCAHLACPGDAAISAGLSRRPRDWPRNCVPEAHGRPKTAALAAVISCRARRQERRLAHP
jgi:hypothetical protein